MKMTAAEMKKKIMKSLHYNSLYVCVKQVELFQLPSGTVRIKNEYFRKLPNPCLFYCFSS